MNNIIFNEIDKIEIYFDNGEYVTLNNNNIKSFDLITNENTIKSFKIKIVDNGDIDFHFALINRFKSPIERLQNKDIYKTNIIYKNGNNEEFETPCEIYKNNEDEDDFGYSSIQDYSCNQHSKLISYKEIELYIAENSREYTLEEALEELKDGDIIIDTNGNEYEICEDNITGEKYLSTILKQSLLKEVFTKKDVVNNETSNIKK